MQTQKLYSLLEPYDVRNKKTALKYLKEVFQVEEDSFEQKHKNTKNSLQQCLIKMRRQKMKGLFFQKMITNNIYQLPVQYQILSQSDKDEKRIIKLKGFIISPVALSIIYILEIIFLLITFFISSCIAFLQNFVKSGAHSSTLVISLNVITIFFSFLKIIITSTSQKVKKGIQLIYVTDIVKNYAQSLILFVDFIYLSIVLILCISRSDAELISIALFMWSILRIIISSQNLTLFRTTFINSFNKQQYYKLFKVIIFNFIFAHFVASILLAMSQIDQNYNWMIARNIENQLWYVQYMWSYYWATTTMMTVGFGDILPVTFKEAVVVSFLEFFSCIVLAYNISQIGGIISTIRSSQNQYITKISVFKRMAQQNQIHPQLEMKIQSYLRQQKAVKQKFQFNQQNQLLNQLPQPLKREFIMASNGKLFALLPFFKDLQKQTLIEIAQILTSKIYYPHQNISKANEFNPQIMILKQGKIGLIYRKQYSLLNNIVVQQIQILERQIVNIKANFQRKKVPILINTQFLQSIKRQTYDMAALTYSQLFLINYQSFLKIIKASSIDSEYFFSLVHRYFSNRQQWFQIPCQYCSIYRGKLQTNLYKRSKQLIQNVINFQKVYYHSKFECPKLHYCPKARLIMMKYVKLPGHKQDRKQRHTRIKERQSSCLFLRKSFKIYQRKRFINQKKQHQKNIQKSIRDSCANYLRNGKKRSTEYRMKNLRKNTLHNERQQVYFDYSQNFVNTQQQQDTDSEEQRKTIIEDIVKFTMQEVYPKAAAQIPWSFQIDVMMNYLNYFPQNNASKFDNLQVSTGKTSKNKALCLVGQIFRRSLFFVQDKNHAKTNPFVKTQRFKQFQNPYRSQVNTKDHFSTSLLHKNSLPSVFKPKKVKIIDEGQKVVQSDKNIKFHSNQLSHINYNEQVIVIIPSIKQYEENKSIISEHSKKQDKSQFNESKDFLNVHF